MRLEYVAGLSWPGDPAKPNDDAFCHGERLAAVFDGATSLNDPLLPVDSDAAWIARKGAEGLMLHEARGAREALRLTASDAERDFIRERKRAPMEQYEMPLASMMLVAIAAEQAAAHPLTPAPPVLLRSFGGLTTRPDEALAKSGREGRGDASLLEFFWFGDCTALVKTPGGLEVVGDALDSRGREAERAAALAKTSGKGSAGALDRPHTLPTLRAARNRVNSGRNWAFSPDARCAEHASNKTVAAEVGTRVLLCSDGFLALVSDYGRYTAEELFEASHSRGLRAMFEELRAIESADANAERYPRFKKSDDATALIIEVSSPT